MGVSYVVGCCNVVAILSMADMVSDCAETVQCMSSAGSVRYAEFKLCYEILLLLKHGRCGPSFMCKTGVNKAEYLVYSMHTNRLSACS